MDDLLTLKAIAMKLGLAESTARYFRDKWPEFMPTVQHGRRKLYRPEAVKVFKIIAEETQKRRSAEEIAERLAAVFAVNVESKSSNAEENAAEQQRGDYSLIIYEEQIRGLLQVIRQRDDMMLYLVQRLRKLEADIDYYKLPWWRRGKR
jgi:DNA-binding transcriptional MerR regulator